MNTENYTVLVANLGNFDVLVDKYVIEPEGVRTLVEEILRATSSDLGYEVFEYCETESEAWDEFTEAVDQLLDYAHISDESVRKEFHRFCMIRFWNRFAHLFSDEC